MRPGEHTPRLAVPSLWALLWTAVVVAPGPLLSAQEPSAGLALRSDVDTTVITLGDPIRLMLWVDHGADVQVDWPRELELSPFEVLEIEASEPVAAGTGFRSRATYVLTAFELGDLELPSVTVPVFSAAGPAEEEGDDSTQAALRTPLAELESDRFGIQVVSVGASPDSGLRDIKGPRSMARSWTRSGLTLLVVFGLILVLWLLVRRYLGGKAQAAAPLEPQRPVHELALEALAALADSNLLERGEIKEFHIRLSEIVRNYLEGQFEVPALERTTAEVVHDLRVTSLDRSVIHEFGGLLSKADLVKFAKHRPTESDAEDLLAEAQRLVEESWMPAAVVDE